MNKIRYLSLMILLLCSIVVWGKASPFARLQADKTTLTVVADPPEGGSVSGGGSYESGTSVQLRASANTGFQFVSWTRDGEVVSTTNSFKYTKGEGDETLVAHFIYNPSNPSEPDQPNIKKKYVLNLVADEGGYSLSGAGTYAEGTTVRVSVYANAGFVFVGWYDSSETLVSDQNRFDYVVTGNETLTARFKYNPDSPSEPTQPDIKRNYVLTLLTEEGGYSLSGAGTYLEGTSARINVYTETGYLFTGWYDSNGELVSNQSRFDYLVTGHATLTARFKYSPDSPSEPTQPDIKVSHRITVSASPEDGGTVSVEKSAVYEGEQTRVRAYTNTGFVFQGWYVADTLFQTASDFYYTMGKKDISMEARFVYNPSSPSEPDVPDNRKYSIYLTSTRGLPGRTVQYPIYLSSLDSLTNIQFNLTFPAGLTPDIENIKLSGKAQGYTLNCEEVEVTAEEAGGAPRRAADRATAYQFTLTDGKLPACNTRLMVIDVAISENVTDTTQQVKINQVTVTDTDGTNTTASTRNGTVEMKESSGDGTYYYLTLISTGSGQATVNSKTVRNSLHIFDLLEGSSTNVYFTPDNGYHIDKVTLDEVDITDQVLENSRYLFSNVNADATLTVMFAEGASSTYNLTLKTDGHGKISYNEVEVGEEETVFSISHGAHVEMFITPDEGYHIKQVLLNDTIDVTSQVTESKFVIESMMTASKVFVSFEETPTVETPLIVRNGNKVAISTTTEEAVIYYTLDGSEPTDQSAVYADSIAVDHNCTVKAIALREDYYPSQVATFEVDWFKCEKPVFAHEGNTVIISTATPEAVIHYTLDGTLPTDSSAVYDKPIVVEQNGVIKAIATRLDWFNSEMDSLKVDWFKVADVTFEPEGHQLTLATETENATVHYSLSTGESGTFERTGVLSLDKDCVVEAYATREGYTDSEITQFEFHVDGVTVVTPLIVANGNRIGMSTTTELATIYYTMDGSTPDSSSTVYTDSITVEYNCTIKAIAMRENYYPSQVATFEVDWFKCEKPVFAHEGNSVSISTATPEAVIHYTLDGTLPTDSSAVYDKPIVVEQNGVIKAIATRLDWFDSEADSLVVDWIVIGDASFDGLVATVSGERMLDEAFDSAGGRSEAAKTIAAIIWNKSTPITESDLQGLDNPNMLIYVNGSEQAPANRDNVVIGDFAKNIVLTDVESGNNNFYCPKEFKAEMISYTRDFQQQTEIGVSRGWESIALPFNVQTIMHEKRGLIAPFGNDASDKHFWLRRLTQEGVVRATAIEANTPYLISMPNSSEYPAEYNLSGRVTFSSQDMTVPVTTDYADVMHDTTAHTMIVFYPAMQRVHQNEEVYALNVGQAQAGYAEGSVFVAGLRDVRPFEAYTWHHAQGPAPRYIPISELDGGATGIEDVRSLMSDGRGDSWYDLNGRRLQKKPTQKGVYILNGTKTVVK